MDRTFLGTVRLFRLNQEEIGADDDDDEKHEDSDNILCLVHATTATDVATACRL